MFRADSASRDHSPLPRPDAEALSSCGKFSYAGSSCVGQGSVMSCIDVLAWGLCEDLRQHRVHLIRCCPSVCCDRLSLLVSGFPLADLGSCAAFVGPALNYNGRRIHVRYGLRQLVSPPLLEHSSQLHVPKIFALFRPDLGNLIPQTSLMGLPLIRYILELRCNLVGIATRLTDLLPQHLPLEPAQILHRPDVIPPPGA